MSGLQVISFTVQFWHHFEFMYRHTPPPLVFPGSLVLSPLTNSKYGICRALSGIEPFSQISLNLMRQVSLYSCIYLVRISSSSILLARDRTLPIIILGMAGYQLPSSQTRVFYLVFSPRLMRPKILLQLFQERCSYLLTCRFRFAILWGLYQLTWKMFDGCLPLIHFHLNIHQGWFCLLWWSVKVLKFCCEFIINFSYFNIWLSETFNSYKALIMMIKFAVNFIKFIWDFI